MLSFRGFRFCFPSYALALSGNLCTFAFRNKYYCNMKTKKITYEQALARLKRSIEVKRNAERRMAEEWKAMGLQGNIVTL